MGLKKNGGGLRLILSLSFCARDAAVRGLPHPLQAIMFRVDDISTRAQLCSWLFPSRQSGLQADFSSLVLIFAPGLHHALDRFLPASRCFEKNYFCSF